MRKRYTSREINNGELAVRDLSKKAQELYYNCDIGIRELDTDAGKRYDVVGMYEASGLTLEELESFLTELAEASDECLQDD